MEKLNQLKLASSPVASSIANSYGALGAYGAGAYGGAPSAMPMLLVVPSLYGLNSQNHALLHQQAAALSGLNPAAFYPSGLTTASMTSSLTSSPTHPSTQAAYGIVPHPHPPPQPPTNLVLNASLSTGNRSLGSEESEVLPPWHVPREHVPAQQPSSPKALPVKTSTIVRNPTHNSSNVISCSSASSGVGGVEIQKVKMRQKKVRNQVDNHFRRSLGSNYETPVLKKRPATIAYSEVDDHFERVFGAEEWKKLQAKRKKMNRHSVI
jgi:hypothetical protein